MNSPHFDSAFYLLSSSPLFADFIVPTTLDLVAIVTFILSALGYCTWGYVWDKPDPHYHLYFERPQANDRTNSQKKQASRNIAERLQQGEHRAIVFWGSQSGTSERYAELLARECTTRFGLCALAADLSDFDPNTITQISQSRFAIFLLSTYGEGDPSDNAAPFFDWIKRMKEADISLANLRYAAFGLGNSNYKYYNKVVDVVVNALDQAGATALLPAGKADDAVGATEEDFLSWKDELFQVFRVDPRIEEKVVEYAPTISVDLVAPQSVENISRGNPIATQSSTCSSIRPLKIKNIRELFEPGDRNCVHMELDLVDHPDLHYKTGDHVGIWPCNPEEEVERLLLALGLREQRNSVLAIVGDTKIPSTTALATLFRSYLEICGPVSRKTVLDLAQFAPTSEAQRRVLELSRNREQFSDLVSSTHMTLARLLLLVSPSAPWRHLPLSFIIETTPTLQPRYYSISSSSVISPRKLSITALVSNKALQGPQPQIIQGLASNYLLVRSKLPPKSVAPQACNLSDIPDLLQSNRIFAHVRKSKLKLPVTSSTPLIMVAAGTGFAPFRAFISERAKLHAIGRPVGRMMLFFGCRHPDEDFIYREELRTMEKQLEDKLHIVTAFSRLENMEKLYVQDRITEYGKEVLEMLEVGANLYICGKASMAREVDRRLEEIACHAKGISDIDVKDWVDGLKKRGKWKADVWG